MAGFQVIIYGRFWVIPEGRVATNRVRGPEPGVRGKSIANLKSQIDNRKSKILNGPMTHKSLNCNL